MYLPIIGYRVLANESCSEINFYFDFDYYCHSIQLESTIQKIYIYYYFKLSDLPCSILTSLVSSAKTDLDA